MPCGFPLLLASLGSACLLVAGPGPTAAADEGDSSLVQLVAPDTALAARLISAGLENVKVRAGEGGAAAYENRRYRHSLEALGLAQSLAARPILVFERRLGMTGAAIQVLGPDSLPRFTVRYPSDAGFPEEIAGRSASPTFRRVDLEFGPLVDYRIGQVFNPIQLRIELQPRLRLNPWPGAAVQLGVLFPVVDDYPPSELDRDAGRIRPGRMSVDQFGWIPGVALASLSGGYFGDNRWGMSLGAARPLAHGAVLLDAQVDRTGYLAFADSGTYFSNPRVTSGHIGISFRPGFSDVAIRARAARFLYGDDGVELEVRRSMGDFDLAYFAQRTTGEMTVGLRLDLPVPPMTRASGNPLRVQPVPRFAISFRDRSEPFGTTVSGTASREEHLRQLNGPGLDANADRYRRALGGMSRKRPAAETEWVSLTGMTGFVNTPWAGVMADRGFETGYNFVPRAWAYDHRGTNANQVYYATLGFLPRVETSMRWTRILGARAFEDIVPDSKLADLDRMSSGRVEIFTPRPGRPGLAVGAEDVQGTRRFHSSYAVAGLPVEIFHVHCRMSLGYGFRAFEANRYVLDGAFGAVDIVPTRIARLQAEFDSEKWNAAIGISPGAGFHIRAVLLNLETLSFGAGWSYTL
ncbi:MAG: YjbH domain-containing protein [Candidatus Eisenbacteria bacterium]